MFRGLRQVYSMIPKHELYRWTIPSGFGNQLKNMMYSTAIGNQSNNMMYSTVIGNQSNNMIYSTVIGHQSKNMMQVIGNQKYPPFLSNQVMNLSTLKYQIPPVYDLGSKTSAIFSNQVIYSNTRSITTKSDKIKNFLSEIPTFLFELFIVLPLQMVCSIIGFAIVIGMSMIFLATIYCSLVCIFYIIILLLGNIFGNK